MKYYYVKLGDNDEILSKFITNFQHTNGTEITLEQFNTVPDILFENNKLLYKWQNDQLVTLSNSNLYTLTESRNLKKDEINKYAVYKIRQSYSVNKEYEMLRKGATDNTDSEFVTYKNTVEAILTKTDSLKSTIDNETDIDTIVDFDVETEYNAL